MARLGSEKKPLILRVQNIARGEEIQKTCQEVGAHFILGVEADKPEDISDLERFLNPPTLRRTQPKVGRNDPCPCGSGEKYKKCCGAH